MAVIAPQAPALNLNASIADRARNKTQWEAEIGKEFEQVLPSIVDKIFERVTKEFRDRIEVPFCKLPSVDEPVNKFFKMDIKRGFNPILAELCTGDKFKKLIDINTQFAKVYENRYKGEGPTALEIVPDVDYINAKLLTFAQRIIDELGLKFKTLQRLPDNALFKYKVELCADHPQSSIGSKSVPQPYPGVSISLWIQPPEPSKQTSKKSGLFGYGSPA